MVYYLVRLQHHHVEEEFGTIDCNDPYDHYIGTTDAQTNLRFVIVNEKEIDELMESYIPNNPFDYESVNIIHEFCYDHEVERFVECMHKLKDVKFT